jgi:hypothetical protein
MVYWLLVKLVPVRLIVGVALVGIGLHYAGVDLVGIALDTLGIPEWSWSTIKPW